MSTPATCASASTEVLDLASAKAAVIEALTNVHGEAQRAAISAGVTRVADRWTIADGDMKAFTDFCTAHFVSSVTERK